MSEEPCHPDAVELPVAEPSEPGRSPGRARGSRLWFLGLVGLLSLVLVGASLAAYLSLGAAPTVRLDPGATIYYNEACSDCLVYLNEELKPALASAGISPVVVKDYINDRSFRSELAALNDALGIPFELQSHLATFVSAGPLTALEGHVPATLITQALSFDPAVRPSRLLVYQDSMTVVESYRAWGFADAPQVYPITTPLSVYVDWYAGRIGVPAEPLPATALLPLVLSTGFLDGLNPCAFAVLLFFVSFLYAVRAPRPEVLRMGSLYAYAVFLAYFLIGLGLLRAILLSDDPHLLAKIAAIGVVVLGAIPLLRLAFPRLPLVTRMPSRSWASIRTRILEGSLPSATAAGFLVGLCTFPCSGGIYVAILGLLAANTTFVIGLGYLLAYNGMYILPLFLVLAAVSNRRVALAATAWERDHAGTLKLAMSAAMVGMGALLLVFSW